MIRAPHHRKCDSATSTFQIEVYLAIGVFNIILRRILILLSVSKSRLEIFFYRYTCTYNQVDYLHSPQDDWSLGDCLASLDSKARIFCEAFFSFSTNSCKPVRGSNSPLLYYPIVKGISAPRQMPASRRVFLRQLTPTRRPVLPYQDGLRTGTQRSRQIQGSS
jgi:hypothetical protein